MNSMKAAALIAAGLFAAALAASAGPSAPKTAAAGGRLSGSAGADYSFALPVGLTLESPARESDSRFTEFAAAAGGEARPFRFEARVAKLNDKLACESFTRVVAGLDDSFRADKFSDRSPAALQRAGGANFRVRVWRREVEPDFNRKSAAWNAHVWATAQGPWLIAFVFYTDARDEASGLAYKQAILNSLKLGPGAGSAVCLPKPGVAASAPAPAAAPSK